MQVLGHGTQVHLNAVLAGNILGESAFNGYVPMLTQPSALGALFVSTFSRVAQICGNFGALKRRNVQDLEIGAEI